MSVDLRVTDFDASPLIGGNFITPLVSLNEGSLRIRTVTAVSWRCCLQVSNRSVARNGQQVLLVSIVQIPAKCGRSSHFVIACEPSMRQQVTLFIKHLQGLRVARKKSGFAWAR